MKPSWSGRLLVDIRPLRTDPGFRVIWIGQIGSSLGREISRLTIPLHVYLVTESPAAIGLAALVQLVATVLLSLVGGALADVFDRRRLLLVADLGMVAASVGLAVVALVPDASLLMLLVLAFGLAALHPVEHPSRIASVARIVPGQRLPAAIAITALSNQTAAMAGPALAGVLIAVAGVEAAYLAMAGGYAWAAAASLLMPRVPPIHRPVLSVAELVLGGLRFARHRRVVMSTFVLDLNAMAFGLPVALLPVIAVEVLGLAPAEVGILAAGRGAGALGAALMSGWIPRVGRLGRAVVAVVAAFSVCTLVLGLTTSVVLAMLLIAICGATDVWSAVMRNAIVQTETPDPLRGRVTAVHTLATQSGPHVGDVRASFMAEAIGAPGAVAFGGGAALAGVALLVRAFPELWAYTRTTSEGSAPERNLRHTAIREAQYVDRSSPRGK